MVQLVVGRVARAHGIRGEVLVDIRTDSPDDRFADGAVLATEPAEAGPLTIDCVRPHSGRLRVAFAGVGDRAAAEALRGVRLVVDSAELPPPEDPEEFHDHQLVGLAAVGPDGEVLGEVVDVVHSPGADLLVVARAKNGPSGREREDDGPSGRERENDGPSGRERENDGPSGRERESPAEAGPNSAELLVPFVREIVPTVDLTAGRVVVDPPPGLLEL